VDASRAEKYSARYPRDPVKTATGPVAVPMSLRAAGTEDWQESHAEQLIHQADMALTVRRNAAGTARFFAKPSGLQEIHTFNPAEDNVPAR
jgi:hypothetical protein